VQVTLCLQQACVCCSDEQCIAKMLHFIGHCHKLDLEKWRENSKLVDVLYLHKSFFPFPPFTCKEVGSNITIMARKTRNGVWFYDWQNMIFCRVLEVFFWAWPFHLPLVSTFGVCHFNFDPQPKLNYCSNPFIEHYWGCSNKGDVYNLALLVHVVLFIHPRYNHNCFSPH